jgi:hypothetical protein
MSLFAYALFLLNVNKAISDSVLYIHHLPSSLKDYLLYISFISNNVLDISSFVHKYQY